MARNIDGGLLLRSRRAELDRNIKARLAADKSFSAKLHNLSLAIPSMTPETTITDFQVYNFASKCYEFRTGRLKTVGNHCYIFVEDASAEYLGSDTVTILNEIRDTFDSRIYPLVSRWFGSVMLPESFQLLDSRIYIFLLDIRDSFKDGYVAGYFDSRDLDESSGNCKPIFYMDLYPCKPGNPNDKSNDFYRTLAHEFQHMVNYSHKRHRGLDQEERWLDEGLSMMSEYLYSTVTGENSQGIPPSPHLSRFLEKSDISLTSNSDSAWFDESALFAHYGASFLFMYYLNEKYAGQTEEERSAFFRAITAGDSTGCSNLNSLLATRQTNFIQVLKNWLIANHVNDLSLNKGLWGYIDKEFRLGTEGEKLPIQAINHVFNAGQPTYFGGEGMIPVNAGRYESISGSGQCALEFNGSIDAFTPFLAVLRKDGTAEHVEISLTNNGTGTVSLDLDICSQAILIPAITTMYSNLTDTYHYNFSVSASNFIVYPVPIPVLEGSFIIILKSLSGPLSALPTLRISFNNIDHSSEFSPVNDERTLFAADYSIPGQGKGKITATVGEISSTFSFYSATLERGKSAKIAFPGGALSVEPGGTKSLAVISESRFSEPISSELTVLSGPYLLLPGESGGTLSFEIPPGGSYKAENLGIILTTAEENRWLQASADAECLHAQVTEEGLYSLVIDTVTPRLASHQTFVENGRSFIRILLSDDGSGIDRNRCSLLASGIEFQLFWTDDESFRCDISSLAGQQCDFAVTAADMAGNIHRTNINEFIAGALRIDAVSVWPNPSRNDFNISVTLKGRGSNDPDTEAAAAIYDNAGDCVSRFILNGNGKGNYCCRWNARNSDGQRVSNGTYFVKIKIRNSQGVFHASTRLAVLR